MSESESMMSESLGSIVVDMLNKQLVNPQCHHCGKYGHRKADCRSKAKEDSSPPAHTRSTKPPQSPKTAEKQVSFYSTFGTMPDDGDEISEVPHRKCNVTLRDIGGYHISLLATPTSIQPTSSEAIFDTGATGTIIIWAPALTDIAT